MLAVQATIPTHYPRRKASSGLRFPMIQSPLLFGLCLLALASPAPAQTGPVISEFMADNKSTLADADGDHPDWIELHNPTGSAVNLDGWYLTDAAGNLTKWRLPAVMLEAGGFRIVFASGKNRADPASELHTNFSLSAGGEYLALVRPGGISVEYDFGAVYPPQQEDVSFGSAFSTTILLQGGSAGRYLVPGGSAPAADVWTAAAFNDVPWMQGSSGYGFGVYVPGILVKEARSSSAITNLATADALLDGTGATATDIRLRTYINFLGDGGDHHYTTGNFSFALSGETHCLRATGIFNIPSTAQYTFGFSSDDGGRLRIDLNNDGDFLDAGENTVVADLLRGPADSMSAVTISAGSHAFELTFFENGGGDEVELYAGAGSYTTWNSALKLIGDTANGGLAAFTLPPGVGGGGGSTVVGTNLQSTMQNVRATAFVRMPFTAPDLAAIDTLSLSLRYNDGFIAWLNGAEIARSNASGAPDWQSAATATRTATESLVPASFNVTAFKNALVQGANVLAIQGLNTTAADDTFLVQPDLSGGKLLPGGPFFFKEPTPGKLNGTPGTLGYVADTVFSHKRGHYTAPFTLTISCATPGATIRYTLDGARPTATTGLAANPPDASTPPQASIPISATTIIRAAAFKTNYDPTNVDTNTFLFLDDVIRQQSNPYGSPPPGWPAGPINGQVLNYGMDPNIVNHADPNIGGPQKVKDALMAIPSICVSLPVGSLVNPATGIYTHAGEDGYLWEREASIEMLNDTLDPRGGFQENCGLRIRGGYSRQGTNPKHAFRILFRGDYGTSKLKYPLFPWDDTATVEFDKFDIQTAQNYSWSLHGDAGNVFLREQFSRDSQVALKSPGSRGRFVHLFLNGTYWGFFQIEERPEAAWAASYLGGAEEDYDVVKVETTLGYVVNPTAGDMLAWRKLWDQSRAFYNAPTLAGYRRMLGQNPDGTPSATDPVLLDPDNLIDYMMVVFFTGNADSPLNGDSTPNNFYVVRDRRGGHGFIQVQHDAEHSMDRGAGDRTGPNGDPVAGAWNNFTKSNPQFTHQDLMGIATAADKSGALEYKTRWGDRVYKSMFNGGPMSLAKCLARLDARAAETESAIIAESARWGDAQITPARNANDWRNARNALRNWLNARQPALIAQLQGDGLFPTVAAPVYNQHGGAVLSTQDLSLNNGGGPIYYTVNGSDPRMTGGALNPDAVLFQGGTSVTTPTIVSGSAGTAWRYLDNGTDQGIAWRQPAFNDSTWKGPSRGQFGYGDNDEITRIEDNATPGYIAGDTNRYLTSYFRTTFQITDPNVDSYLLEILRDDAVVVYLNGAEVVRDTNLPASPAAITYLTPATSAIGGTDESLFLPFTISKNALQPGTNTIAVELHQNAAAGATVSASTDVSLDVRLSGIKNTFPQPIRLSGPGIARVMARSRTAAGAWSALNAVEFLVDMQEAAPDNLVVSEIMYHPANPDAAEMAAGFLNDSDFEFLELQNTGTQSIDLRDCYFTDGITYRFPGTDTAVLAPGARLVLASNAAAFALRYPGAAAFGVFSGNLDNSGETLTLKDPNAVIIKSFTYGDGAAGWPADADGDGHSLVLMNPGANPNPSQASNWRASVGLHGNPGVSDASSFAAWKTAHNIVSDFGDDDEDGLTHFLEYALATDPAIPNDPPGAGSFRSLTIGAATDTYLTYQLRCRAGADDVIFTTETATALTGWTAAGAVLLDTINNGDGTLTCTWRSTNPVPAGQRMFMRAKAELR